MLFGKRARVLIIGAGPAGSATALALRARGVDDVVVVESSDYSKRRIGESLLPLARGVLEEFELLDELERQGHSRCRGSSSSWGTSELAHKDYIHTPFGYGWHLDRARFDSWLADEVASRGVEVLRSTRCISISRGSAGEVIVGLREQSSQESVCVDRVVDATGPRAFVACALDAERRILDQFFCVYGFYQGRGRRASERTLLEACEHGWWYSADLPGGEHVVALACERETIRKFALGDPAGWAKLIARTEHIFSGVRGSELRAPLLIRPATSQLVLPVAGPEWLAVGDAASAFDPLCSHGITKAMSDGLNAGVALAGSLSGDVDALTRYEAEVSARWSEYRLARDTLYELEQRWPDALFWKRRRDRAHRVMPE